jgi:tetratricopeptide (TPR) repeat protein
LFLWVAAHFCVVAAACGALAPDPEEMVSQLPPARDLDPAAAARLEDLSTEAMRLLDEGLFPAAEEAAQRALSLQPRAARPRAVLGRCLMERAEMDDPPDLRLWRRAEGELLSATRLAPDDSVVAVLYGEFLVADGHLTAAADTVERVLAEHPDDVPALRLAGDTRYELGEERLARPHFTRLVELDPDPQHRYKLAWCLLRIAEGELDEKTPLLIEAAEGFAAYLELVPDDLEGYLAEGRALFRAAEELGAGAERDARAEQAVAVYRRAVELDPEATDAFFGLAVALEPTGRGSEAVVAYQQALARDPRHIGALLNLAALFASTDRRQQAEALCRRALLEDLTADERERVMAFLDSSELRLP